MPFLQLRALVVSPSASHPRDYGNRNRVFQTADFLRRKGYEVHFVLYPMEEDWARAIPSSAAQMQAHWASFHVVPPSLQLHSQAAGEDHLIDEWWDPALESFLRWMLERQSFDVVFVNYTFLSKTFELVGPRVTKILDTHDKFAGRRQMLAEGGVEPEFFYTTIEQERIAFERADVVIAIKDSEGEEILRETTREVITLPFFPDYLDAASLVPPPPREDGILRLGFIGADNSVNSVNMKHFIAEFERLERIYAAPLELRVAGNVCRRLYSESPNVKLLGRVQTVEEFYEQVDVIIAPLMFSTGIKIKVGEALAFGKPVLATQNAYDGFPITDPYQSLPDLKALGKAMLQLAYAPERVDTLTRNSALAGLLTKRRCLRALESVAEAAQRHRQRIVFITDQPFFRNDTLRHARLHQWAELSGYLMQTLVLSVAELKPTESVPSGLPYEWFNLKGGAEERGETVVSTLQALSRQCSWLEIIVSADDALLSHVIAADLPEMTRLWVDIAMPGAPAATQLVGRAMLGDVVLLDASREKLHTLRPNKLRYRNSALDRICQAAPSPKALLVGCSASKEQIQSARDAASRHGAELVLSSTGTGLARFLEQATKTNGRPSFVIAFGVDDGATALLRAACLVSGIAFADASDLAVPGLWRDGDGELRVHLTLEALLEAALANRDGNPQRQTESSDTGWSTYWKIVSATRSENRTLGQQVRQRVEATQ